MCDCLPLEPAGRPRRGGAETGGAGRGACRAGLASLTSLTKTGVVARVGSSGHGGGIDRAGAPTDEASGGLAKSGAAGDDVVDEENPPPAKTLGRATVRKGTSKVCRAVLEREIHLGAGRATTSQGVHERQLEPGCQSGRQLVGLVVAAPEPAAPVQRHGNDCIGFGNLGCDPGGESADERLRQIPEPAELERQDRRVDRWPVDPGGNQPLVWGRPAAAIGTDIGLGEPCARKRPSAECARRAGLGSERKAATAAETDSLCRSGPPLTRGAEIAGLDPATGQTRCRKHQIQQRSAGYGQMRLHYDPAGSCVGAGLFRRSIPARCVTASYRALCR